MRFENDEAIEDGVSFLEAYDYNEWMSLQYLLLAALCLVNDIWVITLHWLQVALFGDLLPFLRSASPLRMIAALPAIHPPLAPDSPQSPQVLRYEIDDSFDPDAHF